MMKLRLNVEDLDVVQFRVDVSDREGDGTVLANEAASTQWYTAPCLYCPNMPATARC